MDKKQNKTGLHDDTWHLVLNDPVVRQKVVRESHYLFFHIHLAHYVKYATAEFQKEIFALTQDDSIKTMVVEAFRGSSKSTIMSLSYPIWAILGCQQKKFVVLVAQTQNQAKQYLANIKRELEGNALLQADLGPFEEPDDEWRSVSLVLPKYGARIMVASIDTPLRGSRYRQYRPDLIIIDDLEDINSVKTRESRDKIYDWLMGDVIPMHQDNTRLIVVGTRLHEDSLLMRLRRDIEEGRMDGIVKSYPLINANGKIAWPGMFPDEKAIEALRRTIPSEAAWQREYLLTIIADENRIIRSSWIARYDQMPQREYNKDFRCTVTGVDLATGSAGGDFTAFVSASLFRYEDKHWEIYIYPHPVNERLDFPAGRERLKQLSLELGNSKPTKLYIESVGYQVSMVQDLVGEGFPAEEFQVKGQDKEMRLRTVSHLVKNGIVKFPKQGCEILIGQLLGFGTERYDDLADAFAIVLHKLMEEMHQPGFTVPRPYAQIAAELSREQQERAADQALIIAQEAARSGFDKNMVMKKYLEKSQHEAEEYWKKEEKDMFNKMKRR